MIDTRFTLKKSTIVTVQDLQGALAPSVKEIIGKEVLYVTSKNSAAIVMYKGKRFTFPNRYLINHPDWTPMTVRHSSNFVVVYSTPIGLEIGTIITDAKSLSNNIQFVYNGKTITLDKKYVCSVVKKADVPVIEKVVKEEAPIQPKLAISLNTPVEIEYTEAIAQYLDFNEFKDMVDKVMSSGDLYNDFNGVSHDTFKDALEANNQIILDSVKDLISYQVAEKVKKSLF